MTELLGGVFIADDAIRLACDLEARGFVLTAKDGKLLVSNGSALAAADREGIVRLKGHLLAIIEYCHPEAETWKATASTAPDWSTAHIPAPEPRSRADISTATSSISKPLPKSTRSPSKPKKADNAFAWETAEAP